MNFQEVQHLQDLKKEWIPNYLSWMYKLSKESLNHQFKQEIGYDLERYIFIERITTKFRGMIILSFTMFPCNNFDIPKIIFHFFKTNFEEISVLDACYNRFIVNQVYSYLNSQLLANDYNQDGLYQGLDFIRIVNASIKIENYLNELNSPWRFFDGYIDSTSINTNDIKGQRILDAI